MASSTGEMSAKVLGRIVAGGAVNTQREGFFRLQHGEGLDHWAVQRFRTGDPFAAFGGVQTLRWLRLGFNVLGDGWATFYKASYLYRF